ncbi:AAA family ATPase [Paraburkholderia pallida]|uniref:Pilus assembly protein CpaE n=1 Tax=Paraburkholderia pallida TaxID=2547399 RepID=A0A4P7D3S7_9BURK|nr:AAA family ATPase [Paraburkholderia pallida]QBR01252.1 pilus assembly protein CpaE [Paraburkholderia pallida]
MGVTETLSRFRGGAAAAQAAEFVAFVNDAQTEDSVRRFVHERMIAHAFVATGTVDDAIAQLQGMDRSPSKLLVDVSGSVMPLSDLERLAQVCEPSVQVVTIGDRNDVGLFRNLLKIGVQDYLVKPLTPDLLQRTFDTTAKAEPLQHRRTGKVLALAGTRGGVGTTTVGVALARHLADVTMRRVAYVDLNLNGGAACTLLGITSNNGLTDVLENVHRLDVQYMERTFVTQGPRLFVLSSELDYSSTFELSRGALGELVAMLKHHFHYVLLDVPGPASSVAEQAFEAAQNIYLVADRSVHSAREATRLIRHAQACGNEPALFVLLNNPGQPVTGRVSSGDFAQAIGFPVTQEFPFDGKAVATAENLGERLKPDSEFGVAISLLADNLTGTQAAVAAPWYAPWLRRSMR